MEFQYKSVLVTGAAGFIGFHLCMRLLADGCDVIGIDNLNDYYEVALKKKRLEMLNAAERFTFVRGSIADRGDIGAVFQKNHFDVVVNLAAQPGVRYSLINPHAYIDANIVGFMNILEGCRHAGVGHLVFASSSSVYGANTAMPLSVHHNVDHPISLYAASKKSNELMAHSYSHLYGLPCTGLRFFTVYGPWGRPDMAYFLFTRAMLAKKPIKIFNHGKMKRDFTYIDDIIEGVVRTMGKPAQPNPAWNGKTPDPSSSYAPFKIYNIGNNEPVELSRFIEVIEESLGMQAKKNMLPMQPGDVPATFADIDALEAAVGFRPATPIEEGVRRFTDWYREYYKV